MAAADVFHPFKPLGPWWFTNLPRRVLFLPAPVFNYSLSSMLSALTSTNLTGYYTLKKWHSHSELNFGSSSSWSHHIHMWSRNEDSSSRHHRALHPLPTRHPPLHPRYPPLHHSPNS